MGLNSGEFGEVKDAIGSRESVGASDEADNPAGLVHLKGSFEGLQLSGSEITDAGLRELL